MSSTKNSLDIHYADLMRNHPYGTALYTPLPYSLFHPGSTGYFSSLGHWNPITDLSTPSPSLTLSPALPEFFTWGPKISSSTKALKSSLDIGLSSLVATAVPADLGAWYKFESSKEGGAVLLTKGDVKHERFYYESPFKNWVRDNAVQLVKERPEILEQGFWIATSTWSVNRAALNCWKENGRTVGVGFKAGVVGIGEVAPSGEWVTGGGSEGWVGIESKEGDSGKVVFFGGLKFKYRKVPFGDKLKQDKTPKYFRGGDERAVVVEKLGNVSLPIEGGAEETFELQCEPILELVIESSLVGENDDED